MMHAELDGVICSGARRGKQFTYALLDKRVPPTRPWGHDEALAELARRYFVSHGPATAQDFSWWSGLTATEAKNGLAMVRSDLTQETIEDKTNWFMPPASPGKNIQRAYLLPNYDEYVVGYTDRSAIYDGGYHDKLDARGNPLFQNTILLNGRIAGTWKRSLKKNSVTMERQLFAKTSKTETAAIERATKAYADFLELSLE